MDSIKIELKSEEADNVTSYDLTPMPVKYTQENVILSWKNVSVRLESLFARLPCNKHKNNGEKMILNNVNGVVKSGEILALMGASGSGKTTLLNTLNFRCSSNLYQEGNILINGCKVNANKMSSLSCYVEQDYLFYGTLTVLEHLIFQAMLRIDRKLPRSAKMERVQKVLQQFSLENCKNVKIGVPGIIKGISGGQMKRLAFATETLTDPLILMADEPSSGLDAYLAESAIKCLKDMAANGKTIVCTIHQPSSDIYNLFDKVCFLSEGQTVFFGSRSDALNFFTKTLGFVLPEYSNPADVFIKQCGIDPNNDAECKLKIKNYCNEFENTRYRKVLDEESDGQALGNTVPRTTNLFKSTFWLQMIHLYIRCNRNYFRNYRVFVIDVFMSLVTAITAGLVFYQLSDYKDDTCTYRQGAIRNIATALFFTVTSTTIMSVMAAVTAFPLEIPICNREIYVSVYRPITYYLSKLLSEIPIYIFISALHAITSYFMIGFCYDPENLSLFIVTIILVGQCAYSLGHVISILSSSVTMAISLSAPTIVIQMIFCGFFLNYTINTPEFLKYLKYISVFNYAFDALMINEWRNFTNFTCEYEGLKANLCFLDGDEVLKESKIEKDNRNLYMGIIVVLAVIWRIIAYILLTIKSSRYTLSCLKRYRKRKTI